MKKYRVGIGQIWQEQNTFSPVYTGIDAFEQNGFVVGTEVFDRYGNTNEIGGFLNAAKSHPVELVPLLRAWAWPSGCIKEKTHTFLKNALLKEIQKEWPIDAVLLSLHGSMVAENEPDVEGDLLESIHTFFNEELPIAVSLDLHANITKKMVDHALFIYAYHTCPHTDLFDTGEKTATTLFNYLRMDQRPMVDFNKIPMVTPANLHNTHKGPLKEIFDSVRMIENKENVIGVSVFPVQPWLDVPEFGWSVLLYTKNDEEQGRKYADGISDEIWNKKDSFFAPLTKVEDIVKEAEEIRDGLTVVSDADSTTSGGTGDNVCVLKVLLEKRDSMKALATVVDGDVVREAFELGEGKNIRCRLGGKHDTKYSPIIETTGKIMKLGYGEFTITGGHIGTIDVDIGKTCVIRFGLVDVLISERAGPVYEKKIYTHAGLTPEEYRIVVVKSPVGFRDAYEEIATKICIADCTGIASPNLSKYNFERIPRPMYPFDKITDWRNEWQYI